MEHTPHTADGNRRKNFRPIFYSKNFATGKVGQKMASEPPKIQFLGKKRHRPIL
jgi:hypothetical protein